MPTNTQQVAALQAQQVPPDRECIQNLTSIIQGVVDFVSVVINTQQIPGSPTGDSVAQQALQVANAALAAAQAAVASQPARRSTQPVLQPAGDSVLPIVWTPAMPDTNYAVIVTYYGPNVAAGQYYGARVVDSSRTVNGCQIRLDNTPANTSVSVLIEALTPPSS